MIQYTLASKKLPYPDTQSDHLRTYCCEDSHLVYPLASSPKQLPSKLILYSHTAVIWSTSLWTPTSSVYTRRTTTGSNSVIKSIFTVPESEEWNLYKVQAIFQALPWNFEAKPDKPHSSSLVCHNRCSMVLLLLLF